MGFVLFPGQRRDKLVEADREERDDFFRVRGRASVREKKCSETEPTRADNSQIY